MEELFKMVAARIALAVEASAALIILAGAIEAIYLTVRRLAARRNSIVHTKAIWIRFATWLLLALEFEPAADVVRTAISPHGAISDSWRRSLPSGRC